MDFLKGLALGLSVMVLYILFSAVFDRLHTIEAFLAAMVRQ